MGNNITALMEAYPDLKSRIILRRCRMLGLSKKEFYKAEKNKKEDVEMTF